MIVRKEIEIDLPDDVAERWKGREPVRVSWRECESFEASGHDCIYRVNLRFAPPREPLVTRIARAVLRKECAFTPVMEAIAWTKYKTKKSWDVSVGPGDRWAAKTFCGSIPPHEPGDPETVLVSDINAEVERLRQLAEGEK